jgi:RNA 2',3'-cyclic 3'-phosphodiesterase
VRLFVALPPPAHAVAHLQQAVAPLEAAQPELIWTFPSSWHLTLAFLGAVDEELLPTLQSRLARAARRHQPMALSFCSGGSFGHVLWVGVAGDRAVLGRLAEAVTAACRRAGTNVDEKPYRPHLTLARTRTRRDLGEAVQALRSYRGPSWSAERIQLVRSHLGQGEGRRARHEVLRSWRLGHQPEMWT